MKVITRLPVYVNKRAVNYKGFSLAEGTASDTYPTDFYYDADGVPTPATTSPVPLSAVAQTPSQTASTPTTTQTPATNPNLSVTSPSGAKKKGHFWDKVKGLWTKYGNQGYLSGIINHNNQGNQNSMQGVQAPSYSGDISTPKKGMSKGAKIALFAGAALLIGGAAYYFMKGQNNKINKK